MKSEQKYNGTQEFTPKILHDQVHIILNNSKHVSTIANTLQSLVYVPLVICRVNTTATAIKTKHITILIICAVLNNPTGGYIPILLNMIL